MAQGKTAARGYGRPHQLLRQQWAKRIAQGGVKCWRCGQVLTPGEPWELGHDDYDRSVYRGPEHRSRNRGAPVCPTTQPMTIREW